MEDKFFEVKRKHHYVWADYLKRWSTDGINVFHTTPTRKISLDSVRGLAMNIDFYKITKLSEYDIKVILAWSSKSAEDLQEAHKSYLSDFVRFQTSIDLYNKSGKVDELVDKSIRALESKLLENLHSAHERKASLILKELAVGNLPILYENNHILSFTSFLGHQFSRTKNLKDRVFENNNVADPEMAALCNSMRNSWWFISYMIGMNLGRELYLFRSRYTHALLKNETSVPFITSDQPVINIHPQVWGEPSSSPECLDLYYPINPTYAYVIAESDTYSGGQVLVTPKQVKELNMKMAARSKVNIVGISKDSLRPLVPYIGLSKISSDCL